MIVSVVRKTTHEPLTRVLTEGQLNFRLRNGHPVTGEPLVVWKSPGGGSFFAASNYTPGQGEYYLSTGGKTSPIHEAVIGMPAPKLAVRSPIVRKKS